MKKLVFTILLFSLYAANLDARDYIVNFVEENYKETKLQFSYHPIIYHSIQVNTAVGPKLLVLEGDDPHYRKWLRQYIASEKRFLIKVEQGQSDLFVRSKVFKTDLSSLHPIADRNWQEQFKPGKTVSLLEGNNYFLILDSNETRISLLDTISKKMGYQIIAYQNNDEALKVFKLQPDKFKMILVYQHDGPGDDSYSLIKNLVKISHHVPVVVESGYQKYQKQEQFIDEFKDYSSVHVKPIIFDNLQTTIQQLVNKNVQNI